MFCRHAGNVFLFCAWLAGISGSLAADPAISSQPQSITNVAGSTANFSLTATGTATLGYRWQRGGVNLNNNGRISGATSSQLTIASTIPTDAGDYRLIVTNSIGAATSAVATLTVTLPTTITIPDMRLDSALRGALNKPSVPLTPTDMATLVTFSAFGQGISNLSGLEWATNLTSLSLSLNAISNVTALEGLKDLTQLSLDANRIHDLRPLAGLTKLTSLNVGENSVTNGSTLSSLTNLTELWLYQNPVTNLASLTNLTALRTLVLFSTPVIDISPLAGLTNLTYLELRFNALTNAETALAGLTNLTTLYLGGSSVSNVSFLQNFSQLNFLNLDHAGITDLSSLTTLPALRQLDLGYNPLTNLTGLAAFTNLDSLYLSGNAISNLSTLVGLNRLKTLALHNNQITNLTSLGGLTNLSTLAISKNPLTSWAGQNAFTNLSCLWMDETSFTNLNFIQNLPVLEALGVCSARQRDLAPLAGLTNLASLFADNNYVTNIEVLNTLPRLARAQLTTNLLDLSTNGPAAGVVETLRARGATVAVVPQNQRPQIVIQPTWSVGTNQTSTLVFNAVDDITAASRLVVTALSGNTNLIPNPAILATGTPEYRLLSVTPKLNQTGTTTISLTATDEAGLNTNVVITISVVAPTQAIINDTNLTQAIGWTLNTSSTNFNDLDLSVLTQLRLSGADLSSLSGLEFAVNLRELEFTANTTTNLSVLQPLTKLESLKVYSTSLTDASVLAEMTNLTSLTIYATSLTNLAFLQNLKKLTHLDVKVHAGASFLPVAGLTNLVSLDLSDNTVGNLNILAALTRLTSLGLSGSRITDAGPIATLTNLQVIQLERNRLTTLNALTNLPALSLLNASFNLLDIWGDPGLLWLQARGVTVDYLPQRGPPTLETPDEWFVSANGTSYQRTTAHDDGGSYDEYPVITVISTSPSFVVGSNLFSTHNVPTFPSDYILSAKPPSGFSDTVYLYVIATGEVGMSTTNLVALTVTQPLPVNAQLLSDTNLSWQTGGNAPWFGQTRNTHDGVSAAQSGSLTDSQESWIQTTVIGPRQLSFWWKVSSEPAYDWLEFYTNGTRIHYRVSGEEDWQYVVLDLSEGPQTIRWRYVKDTGFSYGEDAAWLDEVSAKAPASITFSNLSQTYNGSGRTVSVITSPPGLPVSLTYDDNYAAPTNAGSYQVTATIANANYYGSATTTFTINKAPLMVTADDKAKAVGLPVPPLTLRYTGFVAGDNASAVAIAPVAVTPATNNSPPGNFPINVVGGSASNYTFNRVSGILVITNSPLMILSLTGAGTDNAVITWTSVASRKYELQYKSFFADEWMPVETDIVARDWTTSAADDSSLSSQRFYRVKQLADESQSPALTNAPPVILSLTQPATSQTVLTWTSINDVSYRVLYTSDLDKPWFTMTPDVRATNTTASIMDQTAGVSRRFYKVMIVP